MLKPPASGWSRTRTADSATKYLIKLAGHAELHRYVFFASPRFPGTTRLPQLERSGVHVWSVDV